MERPIKQPVPLTDHEYESAARTLFHFAWVTLLKRGIISRERNHLPTLLKTMVDEGGSYRLTTHSGHVYSVRKDDLRTIFKKTDEERTIVINKFTEKVIETLT